MFFQGFIPGHGRVGDGFQNLFIRYYIHPYDYIWGKLLVGIGPYDYILPYIFCRMMFHKSLSAMLVVILIIIHKKYKKIKKNKALKTVDIT